MIYIFIFIFILTVLLTNFILKFSIKNKKKKRRLIFLTYFIVLLSLVTLIYMQISNFWIGNSITNKISNNISIFDASNIKPEDLIRVVENLEKKILEEPQNVDLIKKLAQTKYFLFDFVGALEAFEKGRKLDIEDIDLMIGEANTRLLLEKKDISNKTLNLFNKIIEKDENNISALIVLANYYYSKDKRPLSRKYYKKLLSLIDKNSLEYEEIEKRLENIESLND